MQCTALKPVFSYRFGTLTPEQKKVCYAFGSFNPFTVSHLGLAQAAIAQHGFETMLFVPVYHAAHKNPQDMVSFDKRVAMIRLAVRNQAKMTVSEVEKLLPTPSFTIQTLGHLIPNFDTQKQRTPFLIGSDALQNLSTWHDAKTLAEKLVFIAASRNQEPIPTTLQLNDETIPLAVEPIAYNGKYSSTEVRQRVAQNLDYQECVHPDVAVFIKKHKLYKSPSLLNQLCQYLKNLIKPLGM